MNQQEDKCNLLLKKIAHLDEELFELLEVDNQIDDIIFYKADNTLYKTLYQTNNRIVHWEGNEEDVDKYIRVYPSGDPIDIYVIIDEVTRKIIELEFLDWANLVCNATDNCIDYILDSKIQIEYFPRSN